MKKPAGARIVREGACAQPGVCQLSRVPAGTLVCIKALTASEEVMGRLREMGFCEQQLVKLLSRDGNLICQVCNARLGISEELGDAILVQPLPGRLKAA
jgi:Fe2+ transport system protein FeoA